MIRKEELSEKKAFYIIKKDEENVLFKVFYCGTNDEPRKEIEYVFSTSTGLYFSLLENEFFLVFSEEENAKNYIVLKNEDSTLKKIRNNSKVINRLLEENLILSERLKQTSILVIE